MLSIPRRFRKKRQLPLLIATGVLFLGLWGLVILEINFSRRAEIENAQRQAETLSRILEEQTVATIKAIDLGLESIREFLEAGHEKANGVHYGEHLHQLLVRRSHDVPELTGFHVTDARGRVIGTSFATPDPDHLADRDYFIEQREHPDLGLLISNPVVGRDPNSQVVTLSRRINGAHGEFKGVVIATLALEALRKFYSTLDVGPNGDVNLWNIGGTLLVRAPHDSSRVGMHLNGPTRIKDLVSRGVKQGSVEMHSKVDGVLRQLSFRVLDRYPLVIVVGLGSQDILASWRLRTGFYLLSLCLLTGGFLFVLRRYLRSLELLEERQVQAVHTAKMTSLGIMAAGVAHEINNPLTTIQLNAELLEQMAFEPERIQKIAGKIVETVQRITRIIQGLKNLSRKADGDAHAPVDARSILDETLLLCAEKFRHRDVVVETGSVTNAIIRCNRAQIAQVFLNLLHNSFDAVAVLDEKWIRIESEIVKDQLIMRFEDSGWGIPDEIAEKIMLPFFTTKEVGAGTGLGLSISRAILEAHGGVLVLDRYSAHTCFVLTLPLADEQIQSPAAAPGAMRAELDGGLSRESAAHN